MAAAFKETIRALPADTYDTEPHIAEVYGFPSRTVEPPSLAAAPGLAIATNRQKKRGGALTLGRLWRPMSWPRGVRRAAIVLFPIALPAWTALNLLCIIGAILRSFAKPFNKLWNGRPRSYYFHDNYYG